GAACWSLSRILRAARFERSIPCDFQRQCTSFMLFKRNLKRELQRPSTLWSSSNRGCEMRSGIITAGEREAKTSHEKAPAESRDRKRKYLCGSGLARCGGYAAQIDDRDRAQTPYRRAQPEPDSSSQTDRHQPGRSFQDTARALPWIFRGEIDADADRIQSGCGNNHATASQSRRGR